MLRSAITAWVIALCWLGTAAEAQSRGMISFNFNGTAFRGGSFSFGGSANAFLEQRRLSGKQNLFFGSGTYPFYPTKPKGSAAALPPSQTQARDLPPCRETSEGVVVLRGKGCAGSNKP